MKLPNSGGRNLAFRAHSVDVLSGEEIVLTDHDLPVMKMIPIAHPNGANRLKFGLLKGKKSGFLTISMTLKEEFAEYM